MKNSFNIIILSLLTLLSCKEQKRHFVVSKIKSAAKIATVETTIDKIVLGTKEKRLLGIVKINQAQFVAYTRAFIKSGIDLNQLEPGDVKIDGKRIELNLPHVQVLDFSYPFSSYRIDSTVTRNAFLNTISIIDHERFYQLAELDIRNNLKYLGIINTTKNKTRLMMEGLLKNLGYEEIYISFKEGEFITEIEINENEAL